MDSTAMKTVLIADDSIYVRSTIRNVLQAGGYTIVGEAHLGELTIDMAVNFQPDLITLDNVFPDMMGFEVLKVLIDARVRSKVIFVSAVGQQTVINKAIQIGAVDYLVKPFTEERLLEVVNRHFKIAKPSAR